MSLPVIKKQIPQTSFDSLYFEIIKYIQAQYQVQDYENAGMSHTEALSHCTTAINTKLEKMGAHVGERYTAHLTLQHPHFIMEPVAKIKFLFSDLWMGLFGKCVKKYQTNNKGTYVFREPALPLISKIKTRSLNVQEINDVVRPYVSFAQGLVRGALSALGMMVDVTIEMDLKMYLQFVITERDLDE